MTEELFVRILAGLVDCGVKSVVILSVAWLITRLFPLSAAARHLVWQTAFIVLILLPLLTCFVPSFGVAHAMIGASVLEKESPMPDTPPVQERWAATSIRPVEKASVVIKSPLHEESIASSSPPRDLKPYLMKGTFILWLSGVVLIILRSMIAYLAIVNLRRHSILGTQREINLASISAKVGLSRRWELRTSIHARPSSAMTWGTFRPIVLLPQSSLQWAEGLLEAVLLHELAHVRRRDSANQLMIEAVCALYWCNPLVWICARAIRAEAERAADDLVLHCGVKASAYATELLRLAATQAGYRQPFAGYGLSIVNGSPIEDRIRSIVEDKNHRRGANLRESTMAIVTGIILLLLFATYRTIGLASNTRGSNASAKQTLMSPEKFSANPDSHSSINYQTLSARLSHSAHENGANEIQVSKFIASDLRVIENQDDLRRKHNSPAPDSVGVPADIAESESLQQSTNHSSTSEPHPDRIYRSADLEQKKGADRSDVIVNPNAKDEADPSVRQKKRGADFISPDSPLLSDERQRRRRQQLDVVSPDLLPSGTQLHSVQKGVVRTPTRSPDVRPASQ